MVPSARTERLEEEARTAHKLTKSDLSVGIGHRTFFTEKMSIRTLNLRTNMLVSQIIETWKRGDVPMFSNRNSP